MVQRETTSNVDFEMAPIPVIFGLVTDEKGNPIPEAEVRLEQNHEEIVRGQTDTSGRYRLRVDAYRVRGRYDLSATHGELGDWRLDIPLREGSRETVNLTLKTAMSISYQIWINRLLIRRRSPLSLILEKELVAFRSGTGIRHGADA